MDATHTEKQPSGKTEQLIPLSREETPDAMHAFDNTDQISKEETAEATKDIPTATRLY